MHESLLLRSVMVFIIPRKSSPGQVSLSSDRTTLQQEPQNRTDLLGWPRSTKDPFRGEWERILSLVLAHPERSSGDIFQELQRVSPGRYSPSHLSTLQLGIRKIRARLLAIMEEPWPHEIIQAHKPDPIAPNLQPQEADLSPGTVHSSAISLLQEQNSRKEAMQQHPTEEAPGPVIFTVNEPTEQRSNEESQLSQELQIQPATMTIEGAIQGYLQDQRERGCRPKTMEWHQTALGFFQQYLVDKHHLFFLSQIMEKNRGDWSEWLHTQPTSRSTRRAVSTIATYVRSIRAFGNWMVRRGYLKRTLIAKGSIPRRSTPHI